MLKRSYQALAVTLLLTAVTLVQPERLAAQSPMGHRETQNASQPVAAEPVEIAAVFPSAPELPAPGTVSSRSEAAGFAFAPAVEVAATPHELGEHRFWDRENRVLFAVAGGFATADFFVTRRNLASGGKELNPVTRVLSGSTPGLATNFALEMGAVIGVDYLLHKTGHHKLERVTSFLNIGGSASAVAFGLSHP